MKLRPRPWLERWERQNLQGVEEIKLPQAFYDRATKAAKPWEKYDLMLHYRYVQKFINTSFPITNFHCRRSNRKTIPAEEQEKIFAEVHSQLQQQELKRKVRRRRGPTSDQ